MSTYQFQCDYIAGCHPTVLKALVDTNLIEEPGYGQDQFCQKATELIRQASEAPNAEVFYFAGGTQTNLTLISAALRPHQGVIACDSGHIEVHETGAIEATGHKILTTPAHDGKVRPEDVLALCERYFESDEKPLLVQPGLLYISFPTETGTLYSLAELEALSAICERFGLYFYLDGARLAYGLAASVDVSLSDIAALTDAFYIGGTKCGTLDCEALVITNPELAQDFPALMRRQGALLSKGRLAGAQFSALMTDGLYFSIGDKAVEQALKLRQALIDKGCEPASSSPTNQQFFYLKKEQADFLAKKYRYEFCGTHPDGRVHVRFCTAWSTRDEVFSKLITDISQMPE